MNIKKHYITLFITAALMGSSSQAMHLYQQTKVVEKQRKTAQRQFYYFSLLPNDLQAGTLRNFVVNTIINESESLDEAITKIIEKAEDPLFHTMLAQDSKLLQTVGKGGWLINQDIDYILKYYFRYDAGNLKKFINKKIPAIPEIIEKINILIEQPKKDGSVFKEVVFNKIKELANCHAHKTILNSYEMACYIIGSIADPKWIEGNVRVAAKLQTTGAASYILRKATVKYIFNNIDYFLYDKSNFFIEVLVNNDFPQETDLTKQEIYNFILEKAICHDSEDLVTLALKKGAISNGYREYKIYRDGYKIYAKEPYLLRATREGNPTIVNSLIAAKALPNLPDQDGTTALHKACEKENLPIVTQLLAAGANPNIQNKYGETALHKASQKGNLDIITKLVTAGADIILRDKTGRTAYSYVCQSQSHHKQAILDLFDSIADEPITLEKS